MMVVALSVSGATAAESSATETLLTLYANGEPVQMGPAFGDPFEIATTGPVKIFVPATGLSISCPADPEFQSLGWLESNGQATDIVQTNGYYAGPARECSGTRFGGLLLDGTLHFSASGRIVMGWNELLEHWPQLEINGCYFLGRLRSTTTLPGPLTFTFRGAMRSHGAGCPSVVYIRVGPFEAFYDSYRVEGRISP